MKTTDVFSHAAYLRLLIPQLLPAVDRVIYLDSDLIVERDLSELWEAGFDDHAALAVPDYLYPCVSSVDWAGDTYTTCGVAPGAPYCNTGVLVMNLERWRQNDIGERALEYIRRFPQFIRWAEQDGINAVLGGEWGLLDDRWNVMTSGVNCYGRLSTLSTLERRTAQEQLLRDPFILHFSGPIKPWRFAQRGRCHSRFFDYLLRSRWFPWITDANALMEHTWSVEKDSDDWTQRLSTSVQELTRVIPEGASLILVDEAHWPEGLLESRFTIPFLEKDGRYSGIPPDDVTAISEFERLRESGATFIVFAESGLWWLSYFHEFSRHLRSSFRCVTDNDRVVAFDLECRVG
jgi:lipopolysaccharide biosynthesis glycosyltransferase